MGVVTISTLSFCFGRAGGRFGQRRLYKVGVALYAAGAGLGAISTSFVQLLGARAVMALGLAMALPMSTAILAASFAPKRRGQVLGLFASAVAIGRMTGPALGGFLLGNLVAIAVATLFVHNRRLQEIFFPVVVMFNSIPVVAKAPILVLLMGNGVEPKIAIAALVCFFPTLVNSVRGLEAVNPQAMELMRVLSASKREIFFKLRVYSALPYLFSALRIAASMSVIGAVVGEWIGATQGIGAMIIQATYNFDSALLYAAIVMSAALSGSFFLAIVALERAIIRWHPEST